MDTKESKSITIEEVIKEIPEWRGMSASYTPLYGGLTNSNFRVQINGQRYFVRIPGPQAELLAVDRDNEYHNSVAAAEIGIGPNVRFYLKNYKVIIMEFIDGKTMSNEDMHKPGMPTKIAQSLKLLHGAPRFLTDFNMFRTVEYYMQVINEHKVKIPPDYYQRAVILPTIESAINAQHLPHVPCHNDLVAENFIEDGNFLRIVDYEYSGNNDPCFELGDAATEIAFSEDQVDEMCAAYFGDSRDSLRARVHLYGLVSDIGWVLWTAIQNKISEIDFDFWNHMMFRWERSLQVMDSDRFPVWLEEVGH